VSPLAYVVTVSCQDVRCEVRFNDWPAIRAVDDRGRVSECKLNLMLLQGDNRLQLALGRSPTGKKPECELSMIVAPHGPEEHPPVLLYEWAPDLAPLDDDEMHWVLEHDFVATRAFGRWDWESARRFMPSDEPDLVPVVMAYHRAFAQRDAVALTDLVRSRVVDIARSLDAPPGPVVDAHRKDSEELFSAPDFALEPLSPDELVFESSAGGRLVDVRRKDGKPPVVGTANGDPFQFDAMLSRIGDQWLIVR
jgi:hypothetical protein